MPTYEYECDACGAKFEKFQSITAQPIRKCPACGKNKARRLIGTGAGLLFKGSGFYITDYRSESYKSAAKSDNSGSGSASGGAKSETAPGGDKGTPAATSGSGGTTAPSTPAKAEPKAAPQAAPKPEPKGTKGK